VADRSKNQLPARTLRRALGTLVVVSFMAFVPAARGEGSHAPALQLEPLAGPTVFTPGDESGSAEIELFIQNNGGASTNGSPIIVEDELPDELKALGVKVAGTLGLAKETSDGCGLQTVGGSTTVRCEITNSADPQQELARIRASADIEISIEVGIPLGVPSVLVNSASIEGGGAPRETVTQSIDASATPPSVGFQKFSAEASGAAGQSVNLADSRPYQYATAIAAETVKKEGGIRGAGGNLKNISVRMPPGIAANPTVTPRCTQKQFLTVVNLNGIGVNACPNGSAVGVVQIQQLEGRAGAGTIPLYNLVPPRGMPALLGFQVTFGVPTYIETRVLTEGDFGIEAYLENISEAERVTASRVIIWGVPADPSHDEMRGSCAAIGGSCAYEGRTAPFLRLPSSCTLPLFTSFGLSVWSRSPLETSGGAVSDAPTGCSAPDFSPTVVAQPSTDVADSPTGLNFHLHLPQAENEDGLGPEGARSEADLKDTAVTLPQGLAVNPSSAAGLAACSPAQVGLTTPVGQSSPIHFDSAPAQCPDAAKIGSVEAVAPAVDHPLKGSVFLASQEVNPFGSLIAIYVVLEDPQTGLVIKLAAKVTPDPVTGQLTTTLDEAPQLPVEDFSFEFFNGPRAPLRTPPTCGTYVTNTALTPWTAPEGQSAFPADQFAISAGPAGACPSGALAPQLSAGLQSPAAGSYSPFVLTLSRPDGSGEFVSLTTTAPKGLSARLAGIPYCPEAGISQAIARGGPGGGGHELASPSCPAASQVGAIVAGAGAGPSPYFTSGEVYLAGPYKGAPLSLVAIVPAVAGPFDLGVVTDRIALEVDQRTAQVTAAADPFPTILAGIPLDVRDLRVSLNRPNFTLSPTNCGPASVSATVTGKGGAAAAASSYFQVGGCRGLAFKPTLSLRLKGKTRRSGHPALKAVLTYPKAPSANIAAAQVGLPHAEFLDQGNIGTVCTQGELKTATCPAKSIYGRAKAWTPLLDKPLEGPVYLGVGYGHKLPDLVADLSGQIRVLLNGRVDTDPQGGIRNTFEMVPDAPVSRFVLEIKGGPKRGLLVNSENICRKKQLASVGFTGQNGKVESTKVRIANSCGSGKGGDKQRHGKKG
jgi:hypothetical protein